MTLVFAEMNLPIVAKSLILSLMSIVMLVAAGCENGAGGNPATGTGDGGNSSNSKRVCADFSSQSAAQADYNSGNKGLDGDGNGIACESLK